MRSINLTSEMYMQVLKSSLLPTAETLYPDGSQLVQDNDPKIEFGMLKSGSTVKT